MRKIFDDTIAAISTPIGTGGIGIIRMSGDKSLEILKKVFKSNKSEFKSHTITHGFIYENENIIDEVLVSVMLAPKTYTVEDVVEINCHGGMSSVNSILELVIKNGARLAEPGEFTKRAFLNGRIDLSQAEAVIDVINSKTTLSRHVAMNQLNGQLSDKIKEFKDKILDIMATLEASIDYPEHEFDAEKTIKIEIEALIHELNRLYETSYDGRIIREGINVAIIGKPNVGKSSLLNFFLNFERAIVTDIPGTTRDIIQETISLDGIQMNIIDTAGIRITDDEIEKIGIEKSKQSAENADLILYVLDSSANLSEIKKEIELALESYGKDKLLLVINKTDLVEKTIDLSEFQLPIAFISVKNSNGMDDLIGLIKQTVFSKNLSENCNELFLCNVRHKSAINKAIASLKLCLETIDNDMPEDFISIDAREAFNYLSEITGESLGEDLIDKIFSKFCLGK